MQELLATNPVCPDTPAGLGTTPTIEAVSFWTSVGLPPMGPRIQPGKAVVGMRAYLETHGTLTQPFNADTPFGPLQLQASSRFFVDWGDGTRTGPHETVGGPYPDGTITHVYERSGAYDVVVTQEWTATWSIGPTSGTLPARSTESVIADFPVNEIEAVRDR